jgi:eukaryotic-like serine/threonine-protein kinase
VEGQRESGEYPEGVILSQDPSQGTMKKSNLVLHVYVSQGLASETMPELSGEDFRTAKIKLNGFGLALTVQPKEEYSEEVNAGYVIRTEPTAGEELRSGDTVTLVVSLGRETKPVTVPNFEGMTYDAVQSRLETLHLVGEMSYVDSSEPAGRVVRQSVAPNTEVEEGTSISFEVSLGPVNAVEQRTYVLPQGGESDTVQVRILLDDVVVFDDTVEKSLGSIRQTYSESGTVSVYFDGELVQREVIVIS